MPVRIGVCLNMLADKNEKTGIDFASRAKEAGFDYIEIPLAQTVELNEDDFELFMKKLSDSKIPCEVCNNFLPATMKITGNNMNKAAVLAYCEVALKKAAVLGAKIVVFGSGGARNVDDDCAIENATQQIQDFLRMVSPIALKYGIDIAIEPLNKKECNILNSVKEVINLSNSLALPNINPLVDYYHMFIENESIEIINDVVGKNLKITHTHISAASDDRGYPLDKDNIEIFIQSLIKAGYENRISIEAYTDDFINEAARSIKNIRTCLASRF